MRPGLLAAWAAWVMSAGAVAGCGSAAAAHQRDPMRCERDPACAKARGGYSDCSRQCADNPDCMERCQEVQHGVDDGLGH